MTVENGGAYQKVEILCALKKLGEKLSSEEEEYLVRNMNADLKQFEVASTNISKNVLNLANAKVEEASN